MIIVSWFQRLTSVREDLTTSFQGLFPSRWVGKALGKGKSPGNEVEDLSVESNSHFLWFCIAAQLAEKTSRHFAAQSEVKPKSRDHSGIVYFFEGKKVTSSPPPPQSDRTPMYSFWFRLVYTVQFNVQWAFHTDYYENLSNFENWGECQQMKKKKKRLLNALFLLILSKFIFFSSKTCQRRLCKRINHPSLSTACIGFHMKQVWNLIQFSSQKIHSGSIRGTI